MDTADRAEMPDPVPQRDDPLWGRMNDPTASLLTSTLLRYAGAKERTSHEDILPASNICDQAGRKILTTRRSYVIIFVIKEYCS